MNISRQRKLRTILYREKTLWLRSASLWSFMYMSDWLKVSNDTRYSSIILKCTFNKSLTHDNSGGLADAIANGIGAGRQRERLRVLNAKLPPSHPYTPAVPRTAFNAQQVTIPTSEKTRLFLSIRYFYLCTDFEIEYFVNGIQWGRTVTFKWVSDLWV